MTEEAYKMKEKGAEIARINLGDDYLGALAAAFQARQTGKYGTILSTLYDQTTDNAPNENTWKRVFADAVKSDEVALTRVGIIKFSTT